MNAIEKSIYLIIKNDVCPECLKDLGKCSAEHRPRCNAGYERQAKEIYRRVVEPLEKGWRNEGGGVGG